MTLVIQKQKSDEYEGPSESEVEIAAQDAETRRLKAEGEFLIICNDKKRLNTEIEAVTEDIKKGKITIEENNEKVHTTNELVIKANESLRKAQQDLETFIKESDSMKTELTEDLKKLSREKTALTLSIESANKNHQDSKKVKEQEILDLQKKKDDLELEIPKYETKESNLIKSIDKLSSSLIEARNDLKDTEDKKSKAQTSLNDLMGEAESQKKVIDNNKSIIEKHNITISEKQEQEKSLISSMETRETDINEKSKNLALLEVRVDQKIDLFRQYKEKFTVDELSQMKFDTSKP